MECKNCKCDLITAGSKKTGYCSCCASIDETAREAWKSMGLASFCKECGIMLHEKISIGTGICYVCRNFKSNTLRDCN